MRNNFRTPPAATTRTYGAIASRCMATAIQNTTTLASQSQSCAVRARDWSPPTAAIASVAQTIGLTRTEFLWQGDRLIAGEAPDPALLRLLDKPTLRVSVSAVDVRFALDQGQSVIACMRSVIPTRSHRGDWQVPDASQSVLD